MPRSRPEIDRHNFQKVGEEPADTVVTDSSLCRCLSASYHRPQLPAVLTELSLAVSSVSRVTKRQGCSGLKDLASTLGPALGEASSGRRLIRRVLSQIPGRTWEGKEELLEAAVALCAAGKGSAVTIEPFVWVESGAAGGYSSRGVKRSRSSEQLGGEEQLEEEEEEEEDEEEEGGREQEKGAVAVAQEHGAGAMETASTGASGDRGEEEAEIPHDSPGGAESAFEYEDKLGALDGAAPARLGVGEHGGSSVTTVAARQDQQEQARLHAGEKPRKDAVLETGLASLDMEDDSPVPFGEVVTLMLAQLRR